MERPGSAFGVTAPVAPPQFVGDVPAHLLCVVCMNPVGVNGRALRTPCDHRFCDGCIRPWVEGSGTCPVDRRPLQIADLAQDDDADHEAQGLTVRCPNADVGCEHQGPWRALAMHEAECSKRRVRCLFAAYGCPVVGSDADIADHEAVAAADHCALLAAAHHKATAHRDGLLRVTGRLAHAVAQLEAQVLVLQSDSAAAEARHTRFEAALLGEAAAAHTEAAAARHAAVVPARAPTAAVDEPRWVAACPSSTAPALLDAAALSASEFFTFKSSARRTSDPQTPTAAAAAVLDTCVHRSAGWHTCVATPVAVSGTLGGCITFQVNGSGPAPVMLGVTANRGAGLRGGRHLGQVPFSVCYQSTGFVWTGGSGDGDHFCAPCGGDAATAAYSAGELISVAMAPTTAPEGGGVGPWYTVILMRNGAVVGEARTSDGQQQVKLCAPVYPACSMLAEGTEVRIMQRSS